MDLTQLANLGEFIGGVAVIASLIFVGAQIRLNAKAVRQSSTHNAIETWAGMNEMLAKDAQLAPLVVTVMRGGPQDIDESEFSRISFFLRAMCMRLEAEYFLFRRGSMEEELWRKHLLLSRSMIRTPIGARRCTESA